jgi:hypothetical protein
MVNYLCRASRGGSRQTKDTDSAPKGDGVQQTLRLVALVILHLRYSKGNILPSHPKFAVQHQFFRTRHPLYLILHTNNHVWDPHVIHCHLFTPSISILSPPPTPLPRHHCLEHPPRLLRRAPLLSRSAADGHGRERPAAGRFPTTHDSGGDGNLVLDSSCSARHSLPPTGVEPCTWRTTTRHRALRRAAATAMAVCRRAPAPAGSGAGKPLPPQIRDADPPPLSPRRRRRGDSAASLPLLSLPKWLGWRAEARDRRHVRA